MKLKKVLALLMCLVFAAAVLTGCGGGEEEFEDRSEELDMMVFTDGVLKAVFLDGECFIDTAEGEAIGQGVYVWNGEIGAIYGDNVDVTFTIEDGTLVLEDTDGGIYNLPYADDAIIDDEDDEPAADASVLENTSWWLEDLQYTFLPGGVLQAYNTYKDMGAEGIYTFDPANMTGTVTIEGEYQDFLYRDGQVIIIDGLGDEYPLNPMGAGGLEDDGAEQPGFMNREFYYDTVKVTFGGNNLVNVMYDGSPDFMTGTFEWDPSTEIGFVSMEDGTVFRFAWDGDDMFVYDDEDTEYWMDAEPDQGRFED